MYRQTEHPIPEEIRRVLQSRRAQADRAARQTWVLTLSAGTAFAFGLAAPPMGFSVGGIPLGLVLLALGLIGLKLAGSAFFQYARVREEAVGAGALLAQTPLRALRVRGGAEGPATVYLSFRGGLRCDLLLDAPDRQRVLPWIENLPVAR